MTLSSSGWQGAGVNKRGAKHIHCTQASGRQADFDAAQSHPKVSIILPSYNRPDRLADCLHALAALNYPDYEVVVIDDGSVPPLREVTDRFTDKLSIRYLHQNNSGPARARNNGAKQADGDILAFVDDDCVADRGWLLPFTRVLADAPGALVGGATINGVRESIYSEASQDLVSFLYEHARGRGMRFDFFTSNNMACRRDHFLALGGFDETFRLAAGEDREFGLRMGESGCPLIYVEDAVIVHHHRLDLRSFWRQQRNYGYGAQHLRVRMRADRRPTVKFGGLRFYTAMLSFPFRHKRPRPSARAALLLLSQVAMVFGYLSASSGKTPQ